MPTRISLFFFLLLLSGTIAVTSCGSKGGDAASGDTSAALVGDWSFEDQPTANNPVRSASITISDGGAPALSVQGNLGTALIDFSISGSGPIQDGKLTANLTCTAESDTWQAPSTFEPSQDGKLHVSLPSKSGTVWNFDLVKK